MQIRTIIFIILCSAVSQFDLMAQDLPSVKKAKVDSLESAYQSSSQDFDKIKLLLQLSEEWRSVNPEKAHTYTNVAIDLANKIKQPEEKIKGLIALAKIYHFDKIQQDSAIQTLNTASKLAKEINSTKQEAYIQFYFGKAYSAKEENELALSYFQSSLELAQANADESHEFFSLNEIGKTYMHWQDHEPAEKVFIQALNLQRKLGNKRYQAGILQNLGNNAAMANNLDNALDYYKESIEIMREINDPGGEALINSLIAFTYRQKGYYALALEHYQNSNKIQQASGEEAWKTEDLEGVGKVYEAMEDYEKALSYYQQVFDIFKQKNNESGQAGILNSIGKIHVLKGEYDLALPFFFDALKIQEMSNNIGQKAITFSNIGSTYEKLNQLESAIIYLQNALGIIELTKNFITKLDCLISLGYVYIKQNNPERAILLFNEALELSEKTGSRQEKSEAAKALYTIYKDQGKAQQALNYIETYQNLKDSLYSEETTRRLVRLEAENDFNREKQELAFENEAKLEKQRSFQRILGIALFMAILLILAITWYYRLKQKANAELSMLNKEITQQKQVVEKQAEKLLELDEAKSRFFTNISHEFRTPLTIISGMIEHIRDQPDLWMEKGTQMIKQNTVSLLNLINQILDLRKLESKEMEVNLVQGDIIQYLRYISESFQIYAKDKGVQLHFLTSEEQINMDYDPDKLLRIISNLMSNAIKFTPDRGNIYLNISKKTIGNKLYLQIQVKDTGEGIPEEKLAHVFDRFYQVDDSSTRKGEGTGIGLALSKELVGLLNGEIEAQSTIGKGSTFTVSLPIEEKSIIKSRSSLSEAAIQSVALNYPSRDSSLKPELLKQIPADSAYSKELPLLLIVEDNPDVVQFLIATVGKDYQLAIASNGQEGIDKAIELIPDLIVSDVMMPEKDGYELCSTLKEDERTSHIPIILLTAKADTEAKISGLERGADAYMTKPYDSRELIIRLSNLLGTRKKLQSYFSQSNGIPSPDPNSITKEDAFLQKLRTLIEKNISDPDFGLPQICKGIGMSRSQIFRKVKALTDRSPSIFIRTVRLQKAQTLLKSGKHNVSEVAYEVGFSSPVYFSNAFLEEFGIRPTEILN